MNDFILLRYILENNIISYDVDKYTSSSEYLSPLYLASCIIDPVNYRIVTLLCMNGAQPLLEIPMMKLEDSLPLKVATQANTLGESHEEYVLMISMAVVNIKLVHIVAISENKENDHDSVNEEEEEEDENDDDFVLVEKNPDDQ